MTAQATALINGKEETLFLDFNATIALYALNEAQSAKTGTDVSEGVTEIRALLAVVSDKETPMSKRMKLLRTLIWAMMATEHPEFTDDPIRTEAMVGQWIGLRELAPVMRALTAIATQVGEEPKEEEQPKES